MAQRSGYSHVATMEEYEPGSTLHDGNSNNDHHGIPMASLAVDGKLQVEGAHHTADELRDDNHIIEPSDNDIDDNDNDDGHGGIVIEGVASPAVDAAAAGGGVDIDAHLGDLSAYAMSREYECAEVATMQYRRRFNRISAICIYIALVAFALQIGNILFWMTVAIVPMILKRMPLSWLLTCYRSWYRHNVNAVAANVPLQNQSDARVLRSLIARSIPEEFAIFIPDQRFSCMTADVAISPVYASLLLDIRAQRPAIRRLLQGALMNGPKGLTLVPPVHNGQPMTDIVVDVGVSHSSILADVGVLYRHMSIPLVDNVNVHDHVLPTLRVLRLIMRTRRNLSTASLGIKGDPRIALYPSSLLHALVNDGLNGLFGQRRHALDHVGVMLSTSMAPAASPIIERVSPQHTVLHLSVAAPFDTLVDGIRAAILPPSLSIR